MNRGVTLVEMVIVIALIGVVAAVTALGVTRRDRVEVSQWVTRVDSARAAAIKNGRSVQLADTAGRTVRLLPDGRAIGPGLDQLIGRVSDAPE